MASSKSKSSKISQPAENSKKPTSSAGGTKNREKEASLSKLAAAMAIAPENKKFLFQRLIDRLQEE